MTASAGGSPPGAGTRAAPPPGNRTRLRVLQVVYDFFYLVAALLLLPVIAVMMVISSRWRAGFGERLGFLDPIETDRAVIWIHGVSAGEVIAALELVNLIDAEMPWVEVVLSTTTRNGQQAAIATYPGKRVVYYPLDFSFATARVVDRVRPELVLLMELELWPNFLITTSLRGVPVLLANGRMSGKSARDYHILQRFIPEPMTRVLHYCVQSKEYADRFRSLGVPADRITTTGSMKFDNIQQVSDDEAAALRARLGIGDDDFVLVGGSTHDSEEALLLDALLEIRETDPTARLVLVPRHPMRLRDVNSAIRSRGLVPVELSALDESGWPADVEPLQGVVVVDAMGVLARLYAVADLVFVGGSLTKRGGQNMMEPAGLGKPVVVGPNTWNFRDPMELLRTRDCIVQAPDRASVQRALVELHGDPERRTRLGRNGRGVCLESKGATRRILDILEDYVPARA